MLIIVNNFNYSVLSTGQNWADSIIHQWPSQHHQKRWQTVAAVTVAMVVAVAEKNMGTNK